MRPARPDREDGERFARYFEIASEGLLRWMMGRRHAEIVAQAFQEPGHDFSYEYVWFAEIDGEVAGMLNGYSAADHARSKGAPFYRAAGVRTLRLLGTWVVARRLLEFMDRVPEGDWYLQALAVDEGYRGKGIGSQLIDYAEQTALSLGSVRLALDVTVDNDGAKSLYERHGMSVEATSPTVALAPATAVHRMVKTL